MTIAKIKQLFLLYKEANSLRQQELQEFLDFYKAVVEIVPPEAAKQFGNMSVKVISNKDNKEYNYGIQLNVIDYAWWVNQFKYNNVRFVEAPSSIKRDMLNLMVHTVESYITSPEHKKALMDILVGD